MAKQQLKTNLVLFERAHVPPIGLGLSSVILGAIGMLLFIVPIIEIPIASMGIVIGIVGIFAAALGGLGGLRLCVAGVLLSACGLVLTVAIERAPFGYFSPRAVFPAVEPGQNRPFVPPPAPP